jgi:hypothetical protein
MEDAFENIGPRRWNLLQVHWRSYLPPQILDLPACFSPLTDDQLIVDRVGAILERNEFVSIDDYPKIRTSVFEMARFSMERALYFLASAEKLAGSGRLTAALTTSYLSMFFSARSIMAFLGVAYCYSKNSTWLVDVFEGASEITSQGKQKHWREDVRVLVSGQRMGHEHHWKLFIRMRAVGLRLPLDTLELSVLRKLKEHWSFSERRNALQYNDLWPLPDLLTPNQSAMFGLLNDPMMRVGSSDLDHDLKVAQILTLGAVSMVMDVIRPLAKHSAYKQSLQARLTPQSHPVLSSGLLSQKLTALTV